MTNFSGIFPYLVSPVDNQSGKVLERSLRRLVEHLINSGVHGLSPLGSTGEFAYLSTAQREEIVRIVLDQTAGRVPVLAGVAAFSTREAQEQAERYARLGVDGLVLIMQKMFPVSPQGQTRFFADVAEALPDVSMTLYTNPGLLGGDIPMDVLDDLSHVKNIEYIKDASGNTGRILTMINRFGDRMRVFSASAHIPLMVFKLGGVGWMAGPACVMPKQCVELYNLAQVDDWDRALEKQKSMWRINEAFTKYALAACIKGALNIQGFEVGSPIAPQQPLSAEAMNELRAILADL
ncbi:dihydrodipicolinate synthase family protein [Leminorella grimontii]|uniref:Dihydrodipicolinate synthase family protein n=1 Tax=Leminorella grimontii TaxID=82981 RepID=A0AAV5N4A2_9GAMM|nr:dihydrodipicolinate synthase family protein [Leminorella grimontii]KFC96793.1 dihydrodipicolinate synthase [Leminorella grimontii ATCC 33999 = DSM 5078]GKX55939.1 dihydrodipicolinate synthase family protein [Leminorella grimontii]GKX58984.1 dihydrodipicolinate synthase family protein [Leminorella grimontii]VFS57501.1 Dihydrodipicolinate synthase [Leminorella grimontii]